MGDEYEPATGKVTRWGKLDNYGFWTHGNFVARRKRSGCFSFLPAPRTLFFFELIDRGDDDEVLTCIPLDEPVTEAYIFLGIPLGRGTRRNGASDCVCKTCYRRFHVPHVGLMRKCGCQDSKVERVCEMCYLDAKVLHQRVPFWPSPTELCKALLLLLLSSGACFTSSHFDRT
ncbi:hypothetical protein ZWY2020_013022 [Hordeum vulgare]|nr:hypothetical protein ZWY2020_013022 [Hordeum vulgare]